MRIILVSLIRVYRYAISPLMANHCRYHPSCSSYALQAIEQYGAVKGSWLAAKRLGRCHPFSDGGYDPVPNPVPPFESKPTKQAPQS